MDTLLPIKELNEADFESFIKTVNTLFETAPPLAKQLYEKRPYSSYDALINEADEIQSRLNEKERVEVINAHPRIGAPKQNLSAMSQREQGKGQEDNEVNEELKRLNEAYEQKFGFKFIVFVNGRTRKEIIPVLKERMEGQSREQELNTGIQEMIMIARDRLKKLGQQSHL
ncbi:hypothetical protein RMCBS344292_07818 [Rhizopus microsporus]|nr:hypothetical protein RMCBS344292_07818 [Rhizopus microsporus]